MSNKKRSLSVGRSDTSEGAARDSGTDVARLGREGDIQAVSRTAQIIRLFGPHREHLTASEVATETGLNRTTAYRYLSSMAEAGLLDRQASQFRLGSLLLGVGAQQLGRQELLRVAAPHIAALSRETQLTSALSRWSAGTSVIVHVAEDRSRELVLTVPLGATLDLFTAHSQVWLTFGDETVAPQRYLSLLPPEARARLAGLIERTREAGVAVRSVPGSGYVAVAAPILVEGSARGVLSLVGPPSLLPDATHGPQVAALTECAAQISGDLAGRTFP